MNNDNIKKFIKIQKCSNIKIKAQKLDLTIPNAVWILPKSFEQLKSLHGLLYESDYDLVIKLFRQNNIPYSLLDKNRTTYPKLSQHSFEFVTLPLIAFTIEFLKANPDIISTALSVLNSFFKKRLHRNPEKDKYIIRSTVIKEIKKSSFKKYEYEGPLEGYKDFIDLIKNDNDY